MAITMKKMYNFPFESPLEEEVYYGLTNRGHKLHPQRWSWGHRIDLEVTNHSDRSKYIGLECDGSMFHSSPSEIARDIKRQRFLESKGWIIVRVWSPDWWRNSTKELDRIEYIMNNLSEYTPEDYLPWKFARPYLTDDYHSLITDW